MKPADVRSSPPPKWAQALLRAVLKPRDRDTVAGDLLEEYLEIVLPRQGKLRSLFWYLCQAASLIDRSTTRRMLSVVQGPLLWAVVAGGIEYALLMGVPPTISTASVLFTLASTTLVIAAATIMRDASDLKMLVRATSFWVLLFALAVAATLQVRVFSPVPAVAAFLVIVPASGFQAAIRTRQIRWGIAVGFATSLAASVLIVAATTLLDLRHPPLESLPVVPGVGAILATVGAIFGKGFSGASRKPILAILPLPPTC